MKTIILDKPSHQIFEDAARVFASCDKEGVLCFGVHDWSIGDLEQVRKDTQGEKLIAFQSEVLGVKSPTYDSSYFEMLKCFDEVWDYSEHNLSGLQNNGVKNVGYHPVEKSEVLKDVPCEEKDIDVLHFGMLNHHRVEYLNYAINKGFRIKDLLITFGDDIYGERLHGIIRRSRVILGLHSFMEKPIQESFRYQYPLSNGIPVLAEKSISNPMGLDEFSSKEEMVEKLMEYVAPIKMELPLDKKVSVIMPVFNAARWFDKAIQSVVAQTYPNWELVAVDDGSTDDSFEKLEGWAKRDHRIRVFYKDNEGPAKARAFGLENAVGNYSFFVDTDDEISQVLLESCLAAIHDNNADIAMPNLVFRKDGLIVRDSFSVFNIVANAVIDGQEAFYRSIEWKGVWATMMCNIDLCRKHACDKRLLYGDFNSDDLVARMIMLNSKKVAYCTGEYYYNINPESITKKITPKIFGYLETHIRLIQEARNYGQPRNVVAKIETNALREMIELWHKYKENSFLFTKKEKENIIRQFASFHSSLPKNNIDEMLSVRSGLTPKLQRLLLLRRWPLCRVSLSAARAMGKKNKLYPWFSEEQIKSLK